MKYLIVILCLVLVAGCANDRAQVAADTRAGVHALIEAQQSGAAIDQLTILRGVDARLPAVADVNSSDWPASKMSPAQIAAAPAEYFRSAPPEPPRAWLIAGIGAAAIAGLGLLRAFAPLIPGGGPIVKGVADLAWNLLSTKGQRAADSAQASVVTLATTIAPLAADLRKINTQLLPDHIAKHFDDPRIMAALHALAKPDQVQS